MPEAILRDYVMYIGDRKLVKYLDSSVIRLATSCMACRELQQYNHLPKSWNLTFLFSCRHGFPNFVYVFKTHMATLTWLTADGSKVFTHADWPGWKNVTKILSQFLTNQRRALRDLHQTCCVSIRSIRALGPLHRFWARDYHPLYNQPIKCIGVSTPSDWCYLSSSFLIPWYLVS
jgi:hypothetical protein